MDLHNYIRYRIFRKHIQNLKTLDVGGDIGINTFQSVIDGIKELTLSPYTKEEFEFAIAVKQTSPYFKNLNVIKDNAQELRSFEDNSFQQILLLDVFEHVMDLQKPSKQFVIS